MTDDAGLPYSSLDMCEQRTVCILYLKLFLLPEFIILNEYRTPTVSDRKTTGNYILLGMY